MAHLFPLLPFQPDETPWFWVARMAAFHIRGTVDMFLRDLGSDPFAISIGDPDEVARLCHLAGQEPEVVLRNTPIRHGLRSHRLGNEILIDSLCPSEDLRFCPACLADDDKAAAAAQQKSAIHRRERLIWRIRPVRRCPLHSVPLIRRERPDETRGIGVFGDQVPETASILEEGARGLMPHAPQLQLYVVRRIEGHPGPAWLDDQRLEQAVRVTELLGTVLEFGPYSVLHDLSDEDRDIAAATGWHYASKGDDGIRQALSILDARCDKRNPLSRHALWNTYGALMEEIEQWGAASPIRRLFDEHISHLARIQLVG